MPRGQSIDTVVKATLKGVKASLKRFRECSGHDDWWLDEAPEYFVTVSVAEAIRKETGESVWFEYNMRDTHSEGGGMLRGRPSAERKSLGRYDIVVFRRSQDVPWCVIEVKSPIYSMNDLIRRDIRRLVDATAGRSKGSSIAYGLLAFYTSRSASSKPDLINNMAEKVLEYAQEQIQRRSLEATATVTIQPLLNTTDLGSCAAGCLCIRALRRRT